MRERLGAGPGSTKGSSKGRGRVGAPEGGFRCDAALQEGARRWFHFALGPSLILRSAVQHLMQLGKGRSGTDLPWPSACNHLSSPGNQHRIGTQGRAD